MFLSKIGGPQIANLQFARFAGLRKCKTSGKVVKYFVGIFDLRINKKGCGLRIADSNSNFILGKSEATVPFYYIGSK